MKRFTHVLFVALIFISAFPVYAANEKSGALTGGDLGFKFYTGYPMIGEDDYTGNFASVFRTIGVGADYHISSSIALEPGFFFSKQEREEKNVTTGETNRYNDQYYGPSLSLFYYINTSNSLYIYFGPRFEFAYHEGEEKYSTGSRMEEKESYVGAIAVFGLKYMFNDNFGVFGDIGLGYFDRHRTAKSYNSSGAMTNKNERNQSTISFSSAFFGIAFYL